MSLFKSHNNIDEPWNYNIVITVLISFSPFTTLLLYLIGVFRVLYRHDSDAQVRYQ